MNGFLPFQMGSTMKKSIFDEQTSRALKEWRRKAVKKKNDGRGPSSPRALNGSSPGDSPVQSPTHANPRNHGAEADGFSPKQTVDIMAGVHLPREQRSTSNDGFRDLLSGP
jgi:mlo protein